METRLPLTPEEISHQSLIDQMKMVPRTDDVKYQLHQNFLYSTILLHVERQVHSMFPGIFDQNTNLELCREITSRLTRSSTNNNKFTSRQEIKEEIERQILMKHEDHVKRLFEHFGNGVEDRYRTSVISKLQNVNIHPDCAKNLINFLLGGGKAILTIENELVNYPFYSKLKDINTYPTETVFTNTFTDYCMFLVQNGLSPNSNNYLEYFETLIKELIKEHKRFNLPYTITNVLTSACERDFKKDPYNRKLIYSFIENGGEKEIMELINGLRQTKTYNELPENYDDLDECFKYNIQLIEPFKGILITAILADKGFTPIISREYGETISF